MNNLMYGANPFYNQPLQKSGEPISVNGIESVKAYPTLPNSRIVLFDANEDLFYFKETDSSNFPSIRIFRFTEVKSTPKSAQEYVTVDEFNRFKEEVLNGKQFISNAIDDSTTSAADDEYAGTRSESRANVGKSSKTKSSIS